MFLSLVRKITIVYKTTVETITIISYQFIDGHFNAIIYNIWSKGSRLNEIKFSLTREV